MHGVKMQNESVVKAVFLTTNLHPAFFIEKYSEAQ